MAQLWCFWKGVKLYQSSRTNAFLHWRKRKGEEEVEKNEKKIGIYRGKVRCYVSHANSGEIEKKKKEILQGILHLYYNFQHSCYWICIFSNNPLLINSSNFTKSLIIHCRCTFFPSGSRFRITHVNAGWGMKRDYDGEFWMGSIKLVSE